MAVWARYRFYPGLSWNRDEAVYLWQVEAMRDGHLTPGDGGHPVLFRPWLSASEDGVLFTQYTLEWPIILLVARLVTGSPTAALALGAALAVVGTYALAWEITRERSVAIGAALAMVLSPVLAVQGGVHLSYLFTLGLGLLFGVGLLSGIREGRTARLLGAGGLLGWIFITRPYDAVLWGLAFALVAVLLQTTGRRALARPFLLCGLGALPLVAARMAYNCYLTGSPLHFPITAVDPLDSSASGRGA